MLEENRFASIFQTNMVKNSLKVLPLLLLAISCNQMNWDLRSAAELTDYARRLPPAKRDSAIFLYKQSIRVDSTYYEAYNNLGCLYLQQGSLECDQGLFDSATTAFKQAINVDSTKSPAFTNLAGLYLEQGEYNEAIEVLERVVRIKPDFSEGIFFLGMMKEKVGEIEAARTLYERTVNILDKRIARNAPDMLNNRASLAVTLIFEGKEKEGQAVIDEILQEHPNDSSLVSFLSTFDRQKYFKAIFENPPTRQTLQKLEPERSKPRK